MNWVLVGNVAFLLALSLWIVNGAANLLDRFDRRPACVHCGRRDRRCAEVSWIRTVGDDHGRPAMEARATWMVCGRHPGSPFPEGFDKLMNWCDALEARPTSPAGGSK